MQFYSIHKFSKMLGVNPATLRNWDKKGQLKPHHTSANGYRYYSEEQFRLLTKEQPKSRIVIGYCRVSSRKQKDDLVRQVENVRMYLLAQGQPFEIIEDIGSGINYSNKGLQELLKRICLGEVKKVVVLYKDRLMRFGWDLFESVAKFNGCEIEVIDQTQKPEEQELVEDLVQIITVFSCRLHGKRSNKTKQLIGELLDPKQDVIVQQGEGETV